jgi:uncharacterized protein
MKDPVNRAWKFNFPEFVSEYAEICGISLTSGGSIEMISGNASIKQSLFMLLSTSPGERVMYPNYGCSLKKLAFAENDETTAGLAIHYIREAVQRWEPRVIITRLDARADEIRSELLNITIQYRLVSEKISDTLIYPFDLTQGRL